MVMAHMQVTIAAAVITVAVAYIAYNSKSLSIWGWIASFFPDSPILTLSPLGAANLGNVMILSHTVGILAAAAVLVVADILLIEIAFVKYVGWSPLPRYLPLLKKINHIVDRLQRYHSIPRPARVKRVFAISVLAGVIHLAMNLLVGYL